MSDRWAESDCKRVAKGDEESGQAFDVQAVKVGRQDPRRDDAVLQGQACSRRTLRVVGVDAPAAVGAAHEVPGVQVQENISRRRHAVAGQQESLLAEDQFRRNQALADQVLRAVKIGQDQVEQLYPLAQRRGQRVPLALGQQQRQGIELPVVVGAVGNPGHALHDAVLAEQTPSLLVALTEPLHAHGFQAGGKLPPALANLAAIIKKLVIAPRQRGVVREQVVRRRRFRRLDR